MPVTTGTVDDIAVEMAGNACDVGVDPEFVSPCVASVILVVVGVSSALWYMNHDVKTEKRCIFLIPFSIYV